MREETDERQAMLARIRAMTDEWSLKYYGHPLRREARDTPAVPSGGELPKGFEAVGETIQRTMPGLTRGKAA